MTSLSAIRERVEKASKGPWGKHKFGETNVVGGDGHVVANTGGFRTNQYETTTRNTANADFIAHAREDIPYLLGLVDRYRADLVETKRLMDLLGFGWAFHSAADALKEE